MTLPSKTGFGGNIRFIPILTLLFLIFFTIFFIKTAGSGLLKVDPEGERKIGEKADKNIIKQFGLLPDKDLQKYVDQVGQKLVSTIADPEFDFSFKVLNAEMVNAFALPGGYVYITRGMLAYIGSESELASILGHEIGHVTSHHGVKQMQKSIGSTLLTILGIAASQDLRNEAGAWVVATSTLSQHIISGYGREAEMQSDRLGIVYCSEAGYDPRGGHIFFRKLKKLERFGGHRYHGFLATHPDTIERIISAEAKTDAIIARGNNFEIKKNIYLEKIDGLPFGESEGRKRKKTDLIIKIHQVTNEDTIKNIIHNIIGEPGTALEVAILNGVKLTSRIKAGERIKYITKSPALKSE